jgi:hypothetical protein
MLQQQLMLHPSSTFCMGWRQEVLFSGKYRLRDELGLLQWPLPFECQSMLLDRNDKKSGHAGHFFKSENEKMKDEELAF